LGDQDSARPVDIDLLSPGENQAPEQAGDRIGYGNLANPLGNRLEGIFGPDHQIAFETLGDVCPVSQQISIPGRDGEAALVI